MQGRCLCGNVTFRINGPVTHAGYCHCAECRRQSGHYWASATVSDSAIIIAGDVSWYAASTFAKRGFCARCGTFLFWRADNADEVGFSLGAIEGQTGIVMEKHIFTAEKGDYYQITDGLPQERGET